MKEIIKYICLIIVLSFALKMPAAFAVCLDPMTFVSGYHVPLDEEIQTSKIIAIGEVSKSRYLQEDPTDPNGITAYIYTIRVIKPLKGHTPEIIELRSENDSGRYWMEVGERHLLFLSSQGQYFIVDSCGNSSHLSKSDELLRRVEAALEGSAK